MFNKFLQIWKIKDLRNSIIFVFAMFIVFRLISHIPIPGVDSEALRNLFEGNQLLGLINIFSGGGLATFSVGMLAVAPYITASIIFQLLTMVVPKLEELSKEGEWGRTKINQWTRWLSVPLAAIQAYGMITILRRASVNILPNFDSWQMIVAIISITGGTVFLMWIGELISEKKIGNGISLLIFAGIVAGIPQMIGTGAATFDKSGIINIIIFAVIAILTIIAVVFITEGQRNIPISYARQVRGNRMYGGVNTHLPIRVNQAGVIPIIFAIAIIIFPATIANLFTQASTDWVAKAAQQVVVLFDPQGFLYGGLYFVLVVAFTFFYTSVVFHPDQVSENLQKQGGFIPGIRPGKPTAEYLRKITYRIVFAGALFLGIIAILPLITQQFTGSQNLVIGGTSLLIVVSVVIETVNQINSQLSMRDYEEI